MFTVEVETAQQYLHMSEQDPAMYLMRKNELAAAIGQASSGLVALQEETRQAALNTEMVRAFGNLLPKPDYTEVKVPMAAYMPDRTVAKAYFVADSDERLASLSANVIWHESSPSYLLGRSPRAHSFYSNALLCYARGPHTQLAKINTRHLNDFENGQIFGPLDERTAEAIYDPQLQAFVLQERGPRSIRLDSHGGVFSKRVLTDGLMHIGERGAGSDITDKMLRDYNLFRYMTNLATTFGVTEEYDNLLEARKADALEL